MKILTVLIVLLGLAGTVVSSLALREHYNTGTSPCSINDRWDCGVVNHSPYAAVRGLPVAIIGILGYALLAVLAGRFPRITALGAITGLAFALRLTWIEWQELNTWCIYCVTSQGIIATITVLAVTAAFVDRRKTPGPPTPTV
ncbi:MAG TPA: vitamin K epoxide reductase family protein [Candidatus Saccharimonadales bacterium]|jgi:vitamin-K-epoxide reductase (warfarin-sensitive)|nr:vitamin K epoxide reductase family protein [Candidatus Saccharimonadales bacterium]